MRQQLTPGWSPRRQFAPWRPPGRGRGQAGSGLFASVFGLLFVIGFLLLASEVLLTLHRASVVRAAASDAAHAAAEASNGNRRACTAEAEAAAAWRASELLGPHARVEVSCLGDDALAVTVDSARPRLAGFLGPGSIRRSAEVRFETARGAP